MGSLCGITVIMVVLLVREITGDSPELISAERRLITDLLARYDAMGHVARPVINSSQAVDVQFGIRLVHLDLDEKEQVMKTTSWIRMAWDDALLNWNPTEYEDVTSVVIPADRIWVPDVVLVNTAETNVKEQSADVIVKFNGKVFWAPERKYSSACLIDVTEYPYDRHTCDMWFQSISNRQDKLDLKEYYKTPLDLDTYLSSYKSAQEWIIIHNETTLHERPRDVGMILMWSRRPSLRFSLTIERQPGFQAMLLIIPCTLLSFLIPLVFCLPPERPDRHTLAMSLFASLTILLFMVNEVAPPSASFVPRLALYYCFNLLVLLVSTCCSVVVVNLSKRGETMELVPRVVKSIFMKTLGKCLCFGERLNILADVKHISKPNKQHVKADHLLLNDQPTPSPQSYPIKVVGDADESQNHQLLVTIDQKLSDIENHFSNYQDKPTEDKPPQGANPTLAKMEWKLLSMVLDRLFFIVFLLTNFVSLAIFYPRKNQ